MHEPTIRPATQGDRAAIERMAREVVDAGEMFVFEDIALVLDYWFAPSGTVFVVEIDGKVAGTYVIKPNQPGRGSHVANAGYMVAEAYRGRQLGRRLGEHSLEVARESGYRAVQFNMVVATNGSAVHLWEDLGFRIVGRIPEVFRHPNEGFVDAFVMYRELGD